MLCIAPRCSSPGRPFCEVHTKAPAAQRGGWLSAYRRKQRLVDTEVVMMPTAAMPTSMPTLTIDAHNVFPRIWLGSKPPTDRRLPMFSMVVLCAQEYQPERTSWTGRIVRARLDDAEPTQAEILQAVTAARQVAEEIRCGGRALVTCYQGRNRSAWVATMAMLMLAPRMTPAAAIRAVRQRRDPTCLSNPHFEAILRNVWRARG